MMANNTDIIEATELCVNFGLETVFEDVSFCIQSGQKVALEGRSGSGKSTLFKCLLGFITPRAGEIRFRGDPLTVQSVWPLRRQIAYLSQEPDLGMGTVRQALEHPFSYHANSAKRENLSRIEPLFERFFLSMAVLDKGLSDLSGGQKQRVALISAILLDRSVYLLDEATSALDALSRQAVKEFFVDNSNTVLWISHDHPIYAQPDQTIRLDQG